MAARDETIPGSTTIRAPSASISETVEATLPDPYPGLRMWVLGTRPILRIAQRDRACPEDRVVGEVSGHVPPHQVDDLHPPRGGGGDEEPLTRPADPTRSR